MNREILLVLVGLFASNSCYSQDRNSPLVLTDFIKAAKGDWKDRKKEFLASLNLVVAKAKAVNPKCAPTLITESSESVFLTQDADLSPPARAKFLPIKGKIAFSDESRNATYLEDSVLVCKGDLTLNGPISSSLLLIDGNLRIRGRWTISNSCLVVSKACMIETVNIIDSAVFALGAIRADTITASAAGADLVVAESYAKDATILGGLLNARERLNVTMQPTGKFTDWLQYYSLSDFPVILTAHRGNFFVGGIDASSSYWKLGLRSGDQVLSANGILNFATRLEVIDAFKSAQRPSIRILRGGVVEELPLR